jgi:hypothetical protein
VTLKWKGDGGAEKWIEWQFPPSTLPNEAKVQLSNLVQGVTGWPAKQTRITLPCSGTLVDNIHATAHLMQRMEMRVGYSTLAGAQTTILPVKVPPDSSGPELAAKLHRILTMADPSYEADPADVKVLVNGEKMKSSVAADIPPGAAIELQAPSHDDISVSFRYDGVVRSHTFAQTDTVLQAREFATREYGLASVKTTVLFHASRELVDRQRLAGLRLRPGQFIIVATTNLGHVLLHSARHIPPVREYHFTCKDQNMRFVLSVADTDMIDRVKVHVAEKLSEGLPSVIDWRRVELWFKGKELLNDVEIEAIGIGVDGVIDVTVLDPVVPSQALLTSFPSGGLPSIGRRSSEGIDPDIEALYAQVAVCELRAIRGILKARYGQPQARPPEEEMIALYLRCKRDLKLFRKSLP